MKTTKMRYLQVLVFVLALLWAGNAAMGATTTPSKLNAAYGQSTMVTLHHRLAAPLPPLQSATAPIGEFLLPDSTTVIGSVGLSLTTTFQTSEVLTIPQAVVERAIQAGCSNFLYRRKFSWGFATPVIENAIVTIHITPSSVAAFSLKRIELYFDNAQRGNEIMVDRNFKGLKAYADLYYNGSGFLNGYWEVDGLIIERVHRYVPPGTKITLATPNIPDLPTFDPGYHIVKFIVTDPITSFEVPEMVYWVKGTEEPVMRALALIKPADGADIPADFLFAWEKTEKASVYLISFAKAEDKKVCFSAMTRDASYKIPPSVLAEYLSPGGKYLWLVKGFDTENNIIAESGIQSFFIKEAAKP